MCSTITVSVLVAYFPERYQHSVCWKVMIWLLTFLIGCPAPRRPRFLLGWASIGPFFLSYGLYLVSCCPVWAVFPAPNFIRFGHSVQGSSSPYCYPLPRNHALSLADLYLFALLKRRVVRKFSASALTHKRRLGKNPQKKET